jgi:uncharacterized protein YndB with AHSA1/START domain
VPTAQRTRTIEASPEQLWDVLGDPHHLPRWWPRVSGVEAVTVTGAGEVQSFTEVLMSAKGKRVRADFKLLDSVEPRRLVWSQQVEGTPFARVLKSAETEIGLTAARDREAPGTEVTIELRQTLRGFFARLGGYLVRRAASATIEEALDGLERIAGGPA